MRKMNGVAILALAAFLFGLTAGAQPDLETIIDGYVTSVATPSQFDVNGKHIAISPETHIVWRGASGSLATMQPAMQIGSYVQVTGIADKQAHTLRATSISVRDDQDRSISGIGVIEKVVESGSEPVFRADGYSIRITAATQLTYSGDQKTLAEINSNAWIHFEGKRDKDGIVVASKATFLPVKPARYNAIPGLEVNRIKLIPPAPAPQNYDSAIDQSAEQQDDAEDGGDQTQHPTPSPAPPAPAHKTKTRYSDRAGSLKISGDQKLQERVRRIGISVVPAYQKALPDDDPAKIHFQFTVVEAKDVRWEICSTDGQILVPSQVGERLKSDDQLAAVLADGVALNMQRQIARLLSANRVAMGIELGGAVGGIWVPGLSLATDAALGFPMHDMLVRLQEERGRIALSLLQEGGYDPRQAPEAWRLLTPKHLPSDLNALKYPNRSGYQLSILNLQYRDSQRSGLETPTAEIAATAR